jgi:hypothetical protein
MKKHAWLLFAVFFVGSLLPYGLAQDYPQSENEEETGKPYGEGPHAPVEVPPGKELIKLGGIRMLVAKGTKVEKKGSLVVMEGTDEFNARNLEAMNARIEKMEAEQAALKKTIDDLKQKIADLYKK